jgi:hypothetical protein
MVVLTHLIVARSRASAEHQCRGVYRRNELAGIVAPAPVIDPKKKLAVDWTGEGR